MEVVEVLEEDRVRLGVGYMYLALLDIGTNVHSGNKHTSAGAFMGLGLGRALMLLRAVHVGGEEGGGIVAAEAEEGRRIDRGIIRRIVKGVNRGGELHSKCRRAQECSVCNNGAVTKHLHVITTRA